MPALRHTGAVDDHGRHLKRTNNSARDTFHVSAAAVLDYCDALHVTRSNSHQPSSILVSTGRERLRLSCPDAGTYTGARP